LELSACHLHAIECYVLTIDATKSTEKGPLYVASNFAKC